MAAQPAETNYRLIELTRERGSKLGKTHLGCVSSDMRSCSPNAPVISSNNIQQQMGASNSTSSQLEC
eukprot:2974823-Amphidinium_carterae.2